MTKVGVEVTKTEYGSGKAEVMSLHIRSGKGERLILVVAYIPPKPAHGQRNNMKCYLQTPR